MTAYIDKYTAENVIAGRDKLRTIINNYWDLPTEDVEMLIDALVGHNYPSDVFYEEAAETRESEKAASDD